MLNLSKNVSFAHKYHWDTLYKIILEFSLFPLIKVLLFEATVSERRAKPFSSSLDSLLFDLRMASIIIIMKLGRDSESIASYRTFHNQARTSERASERTRDIEFESFEAKANLSLCSLVPSFVRASNLETIERRFSRGIVARRN